MLKFNSELELHCILGLLLLNEQAAESFSDSKIRPKKENH